MYSVKVKVLAIIGVAVVLASMGAMTATTQPPITETILKNLARADIIVIAIDNSGSVMGANRLPTEKQYAKVIVQALAGKQFAVLSFNLSITIEQPPTRDTATVLAAIDRIQDTRYLTWMNGAIDKACEIIQGAGERGDGALLLATDGFPTTPDGSTRDVEAAIEATRRAAENFKNNCSLIAVAGVDLTPDAEEFLEEIASRDPNTGMPLVANVPSIGANEDFETCDFSRFHWVTGGDADWFVTSNVAHSGHCSARAGRIGDYGRTYLELTTEVTGTISFWYKVSSEFDYDYLCFYIDGHEVDRWSGEIGWSLATFPIQPGTHTLRWEYRKDSSGSYGYDTAWIDDISFGAGGGVTLTVIPNFCSHEYGCQPHAGGYTPEIKINGVPYTLDSFHGVTIRVPIGEVKIEANEFRTYAGWLKPTKLNCSTESGQSFTVFPSDGVFTFTIKEDTTCRLEYWPR